MKKLKRILIVAATEGEAGILRNIRGIVNSGGWFEKGDCKIDTLVTGVGSVGTSWSLSKWFSVNEKPQLAINIGIAGSFKKDIAEGDVVVAVSDCFADAGIESGRGFLTLAEAGLEDPDRFPFRNGRIICDNRFVDLAAGKLRKVKAVTVNTASGTEETIARLVSKYDPDIETMEGAAFSYSCSCERVDYLALRSVSNIIGPRLKQKWNIPLALSALTRALEEFLMTNDL
ncbi:MAG TPA: futalosine hydrolase [Bacteroidales bacterium]|nr:futalosine hydrolase [Bacteroidales bacterium]HOU01889.1 futalosine hydrolase [Bacteroidales bacterium]HQG63179.1 futalosine hydrolase [Bacteroidales bacterium]HQK67337.1 futalosine hydrolase [Bacteroidales bacterium]